VDKVYIADLKGEPSNASKEFFEKGDIEMSLKYDQKPYLCGLFADMLFQKKKHFKSVNYYSLSEKSF